MLDLDRRKAVFVLRRQGHGLRAIARALNTTRTTVGRVLEAGEDADPSPKREVKADEHRERILQEVAECRGNLVRVHEELTAAGIEIGYSTLARFAQKNHLVRPAPKPAGEYRFGPGAESQHDTSPHNVSFTDGCRVCQCASLVLGYSRMLFFEYFPRFTRFECKLFLTDAAKYFSGACDRTIVDNTHVVVLYGTGSDAVIVPEMAQFAEHLGFRFVAHRLGDANRSAKVERPFHYIENNFLVKRVFADFEDLNRQAHAFCDKNNNSFKKKLRTTPVALFAEERPHMKPLPLYLPEVCLLHNRVVDLSGCINLHTNSYSVPYQLIGEQLEVHEYRDRVVMVHRHKEAAVHLRFEPGLRRASMDPKHRPENGFTRKSRSEPLPEERKLRQRSPVVDAYVTRLKRRSPGRGAATLRRLLRLMQEYPADSFEKAVAQALQYGMLDLNRLEKMVLRHVAGDYFRLSDDAPSVGPDSTKEEKDE